MHVPKRNAFFVFGMIQSALLCAIAAGIASIPFIGAGDFLTHWLMSWIFSSATMVLFVLLAAPIIHKAVDRLT